MRSFGLEFRVGLVVIAASGILMMLTMRVGNFSFFNNEEDGYEINILLRSASGLEKQASIKLAGVDVGKVGSISLQDGMALVRGRIDRTVSIRAGGASASVQSRGLLGEKFIEISQGSGELFIGNGDYISQEPNDSGLDTLIDTFNAVGRDIKQITSQLSAAFGDNNGGNALQKLIDNTVRVSDNVDRLVTENLSVVNRTTKNFQTFSNKLNDETPRLLARLDKILASLQKMTSRVEHGQGTLGKLVSTDDLHDNLAQLVVTLNKVANRINQGNGTVGKLINDDGLYTRFNSTINNLDKIMARIEHGDGTVGMLINDKGVYQKIDNTLGVVGGAVDKLDKISLVVRLHNEFLLDSSKNKGYFSVDIHPSPLKFYRISIVDDPRGEIRKNSERIVENGAETTTDRFITRSRFTFSVVMGKRFNNFGIRVGMFENSFGLGSDYFMFKDKLQLSLDAWDFTSDDNLSQSVHMKSKLTYNIFQNMKLNAGYDNFLNRRLDSLFIGGEFYFRDDDLKYVIRVLR